MAENNRLLAAAATDDEKSVGRLTVDADALRADAMTILRRAKRFAARCRAGG